MTRRLSLATVALLAACGGSTEPDVGPFAEERVYVLHRMAGEPLPGVPTRPGGTYRFQADTLVLRPDGTGTKVSRVVVTPADGEPIEERWEAPMTYGLRGDRFEMSHVCPPAPISSCTAPPHYVGSLSGRTLRIERTTGLPAPLEYERVGGTD